MAKAKKKSAARVDRTAIASKVLDANTVVLESGARVSFRNQDKLNAFCASMTAQDIKFTVAKG